MFMGYLHWRLLVTIKCANHLTSILQLNYSWVFLYVCCTFKSEPLPFSFGPCKKKLDMFLGKKNTTKYNFITSHVFNDGNGPLKLELMVWHKIRLQL
jgi:hypothetical protein